MRLNKKNVEEIVYRLYTKEEDGNKVIRRDLLDELISVICNQFRNSGTSIERYFDTEKLIVNSVSKNGIKKVFECPIETNSNSDDRNTAVSAQKRVVDTTWHTQEIISIFKKSLEVYGCEGFEDRKKGEALCADLFSEYGDECRIIRLLFREGVYECLSPLPYKNESEIRTAKARLSHFLVRLGMSEKTKESIIEILITSFSQNVPTTVVNHLEQIPGALYFVSETNVPDHKMELFQVKVTRSQGTGLFTSKEMKWFIPLMNKAIDGYRYLKYKTHLKVTHSDFFNYDYNVTYLPVDHEDLPNEITLVTVMGLCSAFLDKTIQEKTLLAGDCNENGEVYPCRSLDEVLFLAEKYGFKTVLLPLSNAVNLPECMNVGKQNLIFYYSANDVLEKMFSFIVV